MPRHSRKYKRGGRPPNISTDDAPGNGQRVEYAERGNSDSENNIAKPDPRPMELEIGEVDPRSVGLNEEQRKEYHRRLEEGNRLAAQERRQREGRQLPFTRIPDDGDNDDDYDDQFAGRKREELPKGEKQLKKNN